MLRLKVQLHSAGKCSPSFNLKTSTLVLHILRTGHTLHGFMVLSTNPCTTLSDGKLPIATQYMSDNAARSKGPNVPDVH